MLRPGIWPVLVTLLAVAAIASAGQAYAHSNPSDSLTDYDADHYGHLILHTNTEDTKPTVRVAMHYEGNYTYEATHSNGSVIDGSQGSFSWPPESGRHLDVGYAGPADSPYGSARSGGFQVLSGGAVVLDIDFIRPFGTVTYDAYATIDSSTHDSAVVTITFKEKFRYYVAFFRDNDRSGSQHSAFRKSSGGIGHTEEYLVSGLDAGDELLVLISKKNIVSTGSTHTREHIASARSNPVVTVDGVDTGENSATIRATGEINGSVAVRIRDIGTGDIVYSSTLGQIQDGAMYNVSSSESLRPDTYHRYDFAREADADFDDRDSISGFFKTGSRTSTPLTLGAPVQTVDEGGIVNYTIPRSNPENYDIAWSILSGHKGDAAIDRTGRFTWTTFEADGRSEPHEFVIEATADFDRLLRTLVVAVNEVNSAPRFEMQTEHPAFPGLPFNITLNAVDADLPAQTLSYSQVNGTLNATISGDALSWVPSESDRGSHTLGIEVSDGFEPPGTDDIILNITVKTAVYPAAPNGSQAVDENEVLEFEPAIGDMDGTARITAVTNGSLGTSDHNDTAIIYTPRPGIFGNDTITYTVTDNDGLTATGTVNITIAEARVISFPDPRDRIIETGMHLTFLADVAAPESRTLEFSLAGDAPEGALMHENRFDWTPDTAGTHTFNVTVTDEAGFGASREIEVRVVDDTSDIAGLLPIANDIYVETPEDMPFDITDETLRANDLYDTTPAVTLLPDRQNLEVTGTGPYTVTPDPDYNGIATFGYSIGSGAHGNATVIVNVTAVEDLLVLETVGNQTIDETEPFAILLVTDDPDFDSDVRFDLRDAPPGMEISGRTLSWTPTEEQGPGNYTFTILAMGSSTVTETVTFRVLEINNRPVFADDIETHHVVRVGEPLTLELRADDPEGHSVTYEIMQLASPIRPAAFGTGSVALNETTGVMTWTQSSEGLMRVVVRATDANGTHSDQLGLSFQSVQANRAPSISDISNATILAGETLAFMASASDRDDDGDLLFSLRGPPVGAAIDAASGIFGWVPGASQAGEHAMTVTVSDGQLESDADFVVTVLDIIPPDGSEPVANNDYFTVTEDTDLVVSVTDLLDNDLPANAEFGSVASTSPGLEASHEAGTVTITPDRDYFGVTAIPYTITSGGESASADIIVDVRPADDPVTFANISVSFTQVFEPLADKTIAAGQRLTFLFFVDDPDGDELEFTLSGAPDGASVQGNRFDWTPTLEQAGNVMTEYEMTVAVSDGTHEDSGSLKVTVLRIPPEPVGPPTSSYIANHDYLEVLQDTAVKIDDSYMYSNDLPPYIQPDPDGILPLFAGTLKNVQFTEDLDTTTNNAFQLYFGFDRGFSGTAAVVYSAAAHTDLWPWPQQRHPMFIFNVTAVDLPPVLYNIEDMTIPEAQPFRFPLPAGDLDTGMRDLVFGAEGAPEGLKVSGGVIDWTPHEHTGNASYTFNVTVSDGTTTVRQEVAINVFKENSPPVFEDIGTLHGTLVGAPLRLQFNATDTDIPEQTVTYSSVSNATDNAPVVDPDDGRLFWIPDKAETQVVTVTATDNHDPPANASITVVLRAAPFSIAPDSATSDRQETLHIHAVANDDPPGVFIEGLHTENFTTDAVPDLGDLTQNGTHVTYEPSEAVWQLPDGTSASFGYELGHLANENTLNSTITITFESGAPDADASDDTAETPVAMSVPINVLANDTYRTAGPHVEVSILRHPENGMAMVTGDPPIITYTPNATYAGTDTFEYMITDNVTASSDAATVTVEVVNTPPDADDFDLVITPGGTISRDLIVGDHIRDPDGTDGLTVAISQNPDRGSANASGTEITYTADAGAEYTTTFDYTITDRHGSSDNATVTVRVSREVILQAFNDTSSTPHNTSVAIPVLNNDNINPPGTQVAINITGMPEMGQANATGNMIIYTPNPDFDGTDTIRYTISDGTVTSNEATVRVTVDEPPPANTAPTAAGFNVTVGPSETVEIPLTERDRIADAEQDAGTLEVVINDVPAQTQGNASVTGTVITYTARDDATGADAISYTVIDDGGLRDTATISIMISASANTPPILDDISNMTVQAGQELTFDADARDSDTPAQTLTYNMTGLPANAVLTRQGNFSWTPTIPQIDNYTVTITVSDGRGGTDSQTFVIVVTAPDAGGPNQNPAAPDILINAELFFPSAVTPAVTDPDGDDIIITRVTEPTLGVLDTNMLPQISYTPNQTGIDRLNYTASDNRGGTDTGTITIFINPEGNARPALDHIYNVGGRVGVDLEFTATADDSDDTSLTFDIANAPDGAGITAGGDFSWRPVESQNGTHTVTFIVYDDSGGADWQHVLVTILRADETNLPPIPQDIDASVVLGGGRGFQPDISDPENDGTEIIRVYDSSLGDVDRSFTSQGIIVYIAGVLGSDEVIYTVSDGRGGFANGTLSITVEEPANVRPLIEFVGDKSVNAGDELTFAVDARDLDGFVTGFDLEGETQGPSMSPLGVFSWTPTANDEGQHEFTILVFDDAGDNSTVTITVTVRPEGYRNSPPVAPDVVIMTPQDVLSIIRPTLTDPDEGDPVRISQTGQTTKGSILSGFLRAGIIIYLPDQGEFGTETVSYTIADSSDDTDTATINVFISARGNTDPILGSIDFRNINAGNPLGFDLEAEDPDGDTISYQTVGAPDGIEISPQGAFSWTPTAADVGNHTFTVIAYDDRGGADSKTAVIRVLPAGTANQDPNAPDSTVTVAPGGSVVITPAISDHDGDRVTITDAVASGTGVVIYSEDSMNYIHVATAPTETITYTVTDARGAVSTGTITVTIQ